MAEKDVKEQVENTAPGDPDLPGDRKIVVVDEIVELDDGSIYLPGNHDVPADVAAKLLEENAHAIGGKGKER